MKEFKQDVNGERPWHGDEWVALQMENLEPIQAYFKKFGTCVIQGCEITGTVGNYNIAAGIVAINHGDGFKVARFPGVNGVALPGYFVIAKQTANKNYNTSGSQLASITYVAAWTVGTPGVIDDTKLIIPAVADGPPVQFVDAFASQSFTSLPAPITAFLPSTIASGSIMLRINKATKMLHIIGWVQVKDFYLLPNDVSLLLTNAIPAAYRPASTRYFTCYLTENGAATTNYLPKDFNNADYLSQFTGLITDTGELRLRFRKPNGTWVPSTMFVDIQASVPLI